VGPPPNYINLNRTFAPLSHGSAAEESALRSYATGSDWLLRRNALNWEKLLQHPLVVLLGEPGSGKTYELRYQATLSSQGCFRFYFRLDELASRGGHFRFAADDAEHLAKWQKSNDSAIFFLDSVDEAKIHQAADFYRALDHFIELIGRRALMRATIVISSRITEWLPTADGHEIRVRFPQRDAVGAKPGREEKPKEEYPFVVQLLSLDEAAVENYAKAREVPDTQRFLEALGKAHAWELARRPADVNDLLAFWHQVGSLGTLTEILGFVCESQLRKTSDRERNEVLALDRARKGAECLAVATILCRKFIFQIPGETSSPAHAIDALDCLPSDWRNEEVRALLNHALFDSASYGHIRFHHRRISEFLAARWFQGLMEEGCPVSELENLLFETRGSECVLRPSFGPLAAWLCAGAGRWNTAVCRKVIEVAPEILLRYGDPAMLTIADRRALLRALLKKAGGRQRLWWEHDRATLSRLADPALGAEINDLITSPLSGSTLRELGLEIVIAGRLVENAPAVLALAIAELGDGNIFPTAARALEVVGSESDLRALAKASENAGRLPSSVCVPLIELLFPKVWVVSDVFRNLGRMKLMPRRGNGWDYRLSHHLASVTGKENGLGLLNGFLGRPTENDGHEDFELPSSVRTALAICGVMLGWPTVSETEAAAIAKVLLRADNHQGSFSRGDFSSEQTERHPQVRERYFQMAAERRAKEEEPLDVSLSSVMIFHEMVKPIPADLSWILEWLKTASSARERQNALSWGLQLWQHTGRTREGLAQIKDAAKKFPDTRKQLRRFLHPSLVTRLRVFWYQRIRYRSFRFKLRMAWRAIKEPLREFRAKWNLWRYRGKMRSGEYVGWLVSLAEEACEESRNQWSPNDWSLLEKKRGAKCAAAVKEGCKRVWQRYDPPLPHERKPDGSVTNGTLAGLAGIKAAWEEGELNFAKLSFDDARRATHYALSELNGFTPWFDDLIQAHPDAVRSVLVDCVTGEWKIPADSGRHHFVLYDLAWTESAAGDLIKPMLWERLLDNEPQNFNVLRDALCVLVATPPPLSPAIADLAKQRSRAVPVCAPSFPQWMALWLQADASSAIDDLEMRLKSATDSTRVMMSICASLSDRSGHRLPFLPNPSWLSPAAMRQFIPLVYRYIRREDDIDRTGGGGYSPTARDDAQEFRGGLFQRLVATKHPDVGVVLQELLSEPLLLHLSDYVWHLLEKHREQLADGRPWRTRDIRVFAADYERDPQTDADLFRIGLRRLGDLKQWVETGEDSPRKEVHRDDHEAGFRDWLRRRLNETARGRYVVPPEWEIVGGRPDLRLVIPDTAPVSLELKIADEWSLQELLDGLEKQLVGIYLRDHRARYGIYVLALFKGTRTWESLEASPRIDSEQMLAVLQSRAQEILATRVDIAGLEIVLLHFSPC